MSDFVNTVDSIGDEALTNSIIDRSISEIYDNYINKIGKYVFYQCPALTTVNCPAATSIESRAFSDCSALKTVDFTAVTSIGSSAFESCSALQTVNFPAVTSIGSSAFQDCYTIQTLDFPAVTSIGISAFSSCNKLKTLILRSETIATLMNKSAFNYTPIASGTGYIYVPDALVDTYKAASNWSTYANQIRAIEDYPEICG